MLATSRASCHKDNLSLPLALALPGICGRSSQFPCVSFRQSLPPGAPQLRSRRALIHRAPLAPWLDENETPHPCGCGLWGHRLFAIKKEDSAVPSGIPDHAELVQSEKALHPEGTSEQALLSCTRDLLYLGRVWLMSVPQDWGTPSCCA